MKTEEESYMWSSKRRTEQNHFERQVVTEISIGYITRIVIRPIRRIRKYTRQVRSKYERNLKQYTLGRRSLSVENNRATGTDQCLCNNNNNIKNKQRQNAVFLHNSGRLHFTQLQTQSTRLNSILTEAIHCIVWEASCTVVFLFIGSVWNIVQRTFRSTFILLALRRWPLNNLNIFQFHVSHETLLKIADTLNCATERKKDANLTTQKRSSNYMRVYLTNSQINAQVSLSKPKSQPHNNSGYVTQVFAELYTFDFIDKSDTAENWIALRCWMWTKNCTAFAQRAQNTDEI